VNGTLSLPEASSNAPESDALFAALLIVSAMVLALVFGLMLLYIIRYRASNTSDRGAIAEKSWRFEISWTAATLGVFFGLFVWGANLYVRLFQPPSDALKIYVVAKQWMWKVEHAGGQREIDVLHVPVNRPVELLMTSEDVIHDFSVPAFRLKHDVLPGRYEALWFRADRIGSYRLFCTQFCGTDHAAMIGKVVVMNGPDYQNWLQTSPSSGDLVSEGKTLFSRYGCSGCHQAGPSGGRGTVRAPSLNGLYGSTVPLSDGTTVLADDRYIRDSILAPRAQIVASYDPIMPSFTGVMSEEDLVRIVAFIQSLAGEP
jgi:cytochrome c oxidase subunit II